MIHFIKGANDDGVPDLTLISNIDEQGINCNLHSRYKKDKIYVPTLIFSDRMIISFFLT